MDHRQPALLLRFGQYGLAVANGGRSYFYFFYFSLIYLFWFIFFIIIPQCFSQVKEMGLLLLNCSCLAWELSKVFTVYWRVGQDQNRLPPVWPVYLRTKFNAQHPLEIQFGAESTHTYISVKI